MDTGRSLGVVRFRQRVEGGEGMRLPGEETASAKALWQRCIHHVQIEVEVRVARVKQRGRGGDGGPRTKRDAEVLGGSGRALLGIMNTMTFAQGATLKNCDLGSHTEAL